MVAMNSHPAVVPLPGPRPTPVPAPVALASPAGTIAAGMAMPSAAAAGPGSKQLVVVVEGNACLGPHWRMLRTEYIDKIVRSFCGYDASGQKVVNNSMSCEMAVVCFYSSGPASECLMQQTGWTSDMATLFSWLDCIDFSGGGTKEAAVADGLLEALWMCCSAGASSPAAMPVGNERSRHCVLVAASPPVPIPRPLPRPPQLPSVPESLTASGWWLADAPAVASLFAQQQYGVTLSVFAPRNVPALKALYTNAKRGPRAAEPIVDAAKAHPHHLALVAEGFMEARIVLHRSTDPATTPSAAAAAAVGTGAGPARASPGVVAPGAAVAGLAVPSALAAGRGISPGIAVPSVKLEQMQNMPPGKQVPAAMAAGQIPGAMPAVAAATSTAGNVAIARPHHLAKSPVLPQQVPPHQQAQQQQVGQHAAAQQGGGTLAAAQARQAIAMGGVSAVRPSAAAVGPTAAAGQIPSAAGGRTSPASAAAGNVGVGVAGVARAAAVAVPGVQAGLVGLAPGAAVAAAQRAALRPGAAAAVGGGPGPVVASAQLGGPGSGPGQVLGPGGARVPVPATAAAMGRGGVMPTVVQQQGMPGAPAVPVAGGGFGGTAGQQQMVTGAGLAGTAGGAMGAAEGGMQGIHGDGMGEGGLRGMRPQVGAVPAAGLGTAGQPASLLPQQQAVRMGVVGPGGMPLKPGGAGVAVAAALQQSGAQPLGVAAGGPAGMIRQSSISSSSVGTVTGPQQPAQIISTAQQPAQQIAAAGGMQRPAVPVQQPQQHTLAQQQQQQLQRQAQFSATQAQAQQLQKQLPVQQQQQQPLPKPGLTTTPQQQMQQQFPTQQSAQQTVLPGSQQQVLGRLPPQQGQPMQQPVQQQGQLPQPQVQDQQEQQLQQPAQPQAQPQPLPQPQQQQQQAQAGASGAARPPGQGPRYTKLWEGNLAGVRQGRPVDICRMEGYRQATSLDNLAADWPQTMQIVRLIPQDCMNSREFAGKAELLVFRPVSEHVFLQQMADKKLCAVIQLPSQTLLLASVPERRGRLIGMLFPKDMVKIAGMQQQQGQQQPSQQPGVSTSQTGPPAGQPQQQPPQMQQMHHTLQQGVQQQQQPQLQPGYSMPVAQGSQLSALTQARQQPPLVMQHQAQAMMQDQEVSSEMIQGGLG